MKIQPIGPVSHKISKSFRTEQVKPVYQQSFTGSYSSIYNSAMNQSIKTYSEAIDLFRKLSQAAKTENGLFKGIYYRLLEGNTTEALKDARRNSYYTGDLLTSTSHEYPLVSMNSGEISFNDPVSGSFKSSITFWLSKNDDLNVSRLKDYQKFYPYGRIKEFYNSAEGEIFNHVYYNRDGSENTLKNFFLT